MSSRRSSSLDAGPARPHRTAIRTPVPESDARMVPPKDAGLTTLDELLGEGWDRDCDDGEDLLREVLGPDWEAMLG